MTGGVLAALAIVPLGLVACGDDEPTSAAPPATEKAAKPAAAPTALAITTSDAEAKRFRTEAPASIKGGLVELTFTNAGKDDHEAQLVRIEGDHTAQEALKFYGAEEGAIPDWMTLEGGAGNTGPGKTAKSTMNLKPGQYAMLDDADFMGPVNSSRGALATFEVTAGEPGELPASTATVVGVDNDSGSPHHEFEVSGLKVGKNRLRFENKGTEPHHVVMFPILPGKSLKDVGAAFGENAPPGPPPVDFANGAGTSILDGKRVEVAEIELRKAGPYALVCFITDRDGKGKPHLERGMLKKVVVE